MRGRSSWTAPIRRDPLVDGGLGARARVVGGSDDVGASGEGDAGDAVPETVGVLGGGDAAEAVGIEVDVLLECLVLAAAGEDVGVDERHGDGRSYPPREALVGCAVAASRRTSAGLAGAGAAKREGACHGIFSRMSRSLYAASSVESPADATARMDSPMESVLLPRMRTGWA